MASRDRRMRRIFRWLTVLAMVVGVLSTLIYASGGHLIIRRFNPRVGAWWDLHQFAMMEVSATALGMLIAIRCAARMLDDADLRRRAMTASLAASAIIVIPLFRAVASLARLGWDAHSARIRNFLQAIADYGVGNILDKIVMGSVYFLKSVAVATLAGLALFAIATVILMSFEKSDPAVEHREAPLP